MENTLEDGLTNEAKAALARLLRDWGPCTLQVGNRLTAIVIALRHKPELLGHELFTPMDHALANQPGLIKAEARRLDRSGELLIRVALDFWSDSGDVRLTELCEVLNDQDFRAVLDGMLRLQRVNLAP